jgi:hypothetical protein
MRKNAAHDRKNIGSMAIGFCLLRPAAKLSRLRDVRGISECGSIGLLGRQRRFGSLR